MGKEPYCSRLAALREKMKQAGIDAYLVVTDDFHASEYVGDYFKCREFLSGFNGSAGTLVVTAEQAGLWTDGRYFLQAAEQLAGTGVELRKMGEPDVPTVTAYLAEALPECGCVGYDGRTVSVDLAERIERALAKKRATYRQDVDLVGELWTDRPAFPHAPVWLLDTCYTGMSRAEKLRRLRQQIRQSGAEANLIAALDEIAWLYNLRGADVAYHPVAMSYTLVTMQTATLYIAPEAVSAPVAAALQEDGVTLRPYLCVYSDVQTLTGRLLVDKSSINVALLNAIGPAAERVFAADPAQRMKAVKTPVEQENMQLAHLRDGVCMTKLIFWLRHLPDVSAVTELDVSEKLEALRREQRDYLGASFPSIIAAGRHGAIIHYEPSRETNVPLEPDQFVLMDTGAHFLQGTTDITRTVSLGSVSDRQKRHYTAVLRGNLALAAAVFRHGCTGVHLDALARMPLWELGCDFNHGTGHGVGYLLNVHEGPNCIGLRCADGGLGAVLEPGMVTSDEPGLYFEGEYGIRLENLLLTVERETTPSGRFLGFRALTLVPFDRAAIMPEQMNESERRTLNEYHERVYQTISPFLTAEERAWLREQTLPL